MPTKITSVPKPAVKTVTKPDPPKPVEDYPVIPADPVPDDSKDDSKDDKDDEPTVVGIPFLGGKGCSGDCKDGKKDLIHDLKD